MSMLTLANKTMILLLVLIAATLYVLYHLFPEYDMHVYSRCRRCHQLDTWGGTNVPLTIVTTLVIIMFITIITITIIAGKVFGIRLRPQGYEAVSFDWNADEGNVYALQSIAAPTKTKVESAPSSSSSSSSTWSIGERIFDILCSFGFTVETSKGSPDGGANTHFWPCKFF